MSAFYKSSVLRGYPFIVPSKDDNWSGIRKKGREFKHMAFQFLVFHLTGDKVFFMPALLDYLNCSSKFCSLGIADPFEFWKDFILEKGGAGSTHASVDEDLWVFQS